MSFRTPKKSIAGQIAALQNFNGLADVRNRNIRESDRSLLQRRGGAIAFLFRIITLIVGSEILKVIIGRILNQVLKNLESTIKNEIKNKLKEELPDVSSGSKNSQSTTISIPPSRLESNNYLKENYSGCNLKIAFPDPNSPNRQLYDIMRNPQGGAIGGLGVNYINNDVIINLGNAQSSNQNIKEFLINNAQGIDGMSFVNIREIIITLLELLIGKLKNSHSKKTAKEQAELAIAIENATLDDRTGNVYDFTAEELNLIAELEDTFNKGFLLVVGCDQFNVPPNIDQICQDLDSSSFNNGAEINNFLNKSYDNQIEKRSNIPFNDKNNAKNSFFDRIGTLLLMAVGINLFNNVNFRIIMSLISQVRIGGSLSVIQSPLELIRENQDIFRCVMKNISGLIAEALYNEFRRRLRTLMSGLLSQLAREALNNFVLSIRSIRGGRN